MFFVFTISFTSILEKLQVEEKYFGRNEADARLDCLFLFPSSREKMWMVPWSLDTQSREESELKLMQNMVAGFDPRRSSVTRLPFTASNTRIRVPFTLAVANLVPITKQRNFLRIYIDWFAASLTGFGTKIFEQLIQCPEMDKSCFLATNQRLLD